MDGNTAQTIVPLPNNIPYIAAVVIMMLVGVAAAVAITFARPTTDNTLLIGSVFGFLLPTTLSLLAFMKAQETHLSVNSRLDAFMTQARLEAHALGVSEGRVTAERRADFLSRSGFDKGKPPDV